MLDISKYRHIVGRGTDETEQTKPARQQGWEEKGAEHEEEQQYPSTESREKLRDIIRRRQEVRNEQGGGVKASLEDISLYEQQDMQRKEAMAENERMYQEFLKHKREHNWKMIHKKFKDRIAEARHEENQEKLDSLVAEMKAEQKVFLETFKNTNRPCYKEMLDSRYKEIDRHFDDRDGNPEESHRHKRHLLKKRGPPTSEINLQRRRGLLQRELNASRRMLKEFCSWRGIYSSCNHNHDLYTINSTSISLHERLMQRQAVQLLLIPIRGRIW